MVLLHAPSGRHYVVARISYPTLESLPDAGDIACGEQTPPFVRANAGDVIELYVCRGNWGYGAKLIRLRDSLEAEACKSTCHQNALMPGARGPEGAFNLDWVRGIKFQRGRLEPVEMDVRSPEYGFNAPWPKDSAGRFRTKRYLQQLDRVEVVWPLVLRLADGQERDPSGLAEMRVQTETALRGLQKRAGDRFRILRAAVRVSENAGASHSKDASDDLAFTREVIARLVAAKRRLSDDETSPQLLADGVLFMPPGLEPEELGTSPVSRRSRLNSEEKAHAKLSQASASASQSPHVKPLQAPASGSQSPFTRPMQTLPSASQSSYHKPVHAPAIGPQSPYAKPAQCPTSAAQSPHANPAPAPTIFVHPDEDEEVGDGDEEAAEADYDVERGIGTDTSPRLRAHVRPVARRLASGLLNAKRSGQLHALAEELAKAQDFAKAQEFAKDDIVSLHVIKEKFKAAVLSAHRTGELHKVAGDLASEVEEKVDEFQRLKERALQSNLELQRLARQISNDEPSRACSSHERQKRNSRRQQTGQLERISQEMAHTQGQLEATAVELGDVAARMRRGLLNARRSGELERLAGEMAQELESKAESIRAKLRRGMLRAHRTGELQELRGELDELADVVPGLQGTSFAAHSSPSPPEAQRKRWAEISSDSDFDWRTAAARQFAPPGADAASDSASERDVDPIQRVSSPAVVDNTSDSASEWDHSPAPASKGPRNLVTGPASAAAPSPKRRIARTLLDAKRSGELQALVEEFASAQTDIVSSARNSASDLQALREKFKDVVIGAHRSGELHKLAGDLAREVEQKADQFQRLKERALQSILDMKRSGELKQLAKEMAHGERTHELPAKQRALQSILKMKRSGALENLAQEMADTQDELAAKAVQLRDVAARMRRGLIDARRSGELERIVGEMAQVLETKVESIRSKFRRGLLRAHRTGELQELRGELDEMADVVPGLGSELPQAPQDAQVAASIGSAPAARAPSLSKKKRWSEMTSSDSDVDPRQVQAAQSAVTGRSRAGGSAQPSGTHVDDYSDSVSESDTQGAS